MLRSHELSAPNLAYIENVKARIAGGQNVRTWDVRFALRYNPNDPEVVPYRRVIRDQARMKNIAAIQAKLDSGLDKVGRGKKSKKKEVILSPAKRESLTQQLAAINARLTLNSS